MKQAIRFFENMLVIAIALVFVYMALGVPLTPTTLTTTFGVATGSYLLRKALQPVTKALLHKLAAAEPGSAIRQTTQVVLVALSGIVAGQVGWHDPVRGGVAGCVIGLLVMAVSNAFDIQINISNEPLQLVNDKDLAEQIVEARMRGQEDLRQGPLATHVAYVEEFGIILLSLNDGETLQLSPYLIQGLQHGKPIQLRDVKIVGMGTGLRWEKLDVDLSVRGLANGIYGSQHWMQDARLG